MTDPVVSSYPGYATPTFEHYGQWIVRAEPWSPYVGRLSEFAAGWTAWDPRDLYVGLFPDKQAAGEALVRHAGYEVLR